MQKTYGKFLAIACAVTVLSSSQLLLNNLYKANAAVVVFPTESRGKTGMADFHEHAAAENNFGLAMDAADKIEARAFKPILTAEAARAAAEFKPLRVSQNGILPIEGSDSILFSNLTNSQLSGCSTRGVIELHHTGSYADALIVLRNETYRFNNNFLLPIKVRKIESNGAGSQEFRIKAQMMRCPSKLARGN